MQLSHEKQISTKKPVNHRAITETWDKLPFYAQDYYVSNRVLKKYNNVYVTEHGVLFTGNTVINESYIFPNHSIKFSRSFLQKRNTKKIKSENNLVLFNYWSVNYFHCSVSENNCFYLTKENLEQIDVLLEKC